MRIFLDIDRELVRPVRGHAKRLGQHCKPRRAPGVRFPKTRGIPEWEFAEVSPKGREILRFGRKVCVHDVRLIFPCQRRVSQAHAALRGSGTGILSTAPERHNPVRAVVPIHGVISSIHQPSQTRPMRSLKLRGPHAEREFIYSSGTLSALRRLYAGVSSNGHDVQF